LAADSSSFWGFFPFSVAVAGEDAAAVEKKSEKEGKRNLRGGIPPKHTPDT
jgi:hypothetical protein